MLKGARVWQCSPDAPWDFTWRFRRLGNVPRGKAWARLGNRPQGFDRPREPSLRKPPVFTHSARERDEASSGAGSAGGCTVQGPQLVPRFVSRVLRRWPTARRVRVGDRADSKQRKKTRAARCLLAAAEACTRRRGHYGGFFAAVTACAGAACLAASTTSEKLAAAASSSVALRVLNRHRPETRKLDGWKVSIQAKNECKNKDKSMRNAR